MAVLTSAVIAALIYSGNFGQIVTISVRSAGSSDVSILLRFGFLGVNCSFGISQVFTFSGLVFLESRTSNPKIGGSSPPGRVG